MDCEWRRRTTDDGRQTDDMLKPHTISSADRVNEKERKNGSNPKFEISQFFEHFGRDLYA